MKIIGTKKSDLLHDGPDATKFWSKGGFDIFHFNDLAVDKIKDFNVNKDTIAVWHLSFAPIDHYITINEGQNETLFPVRVDRPDDWSLVYGGHKACDDPGFAYNKHNGRLWYDVDGSGDHAAVLIAKIGKGLDLSDDNLVIT